MTVLQNVKNLGSVHITMMFASKPNAHKSHSHQRFVDYYSLYFSFFDHKQYVVATFQLSMKLIKFNNCDIAV